MSSNSEGTPGHEPSPPAQMRKLLASGRTLWATGAHDALSAKFADSAGFDFVVSSGFGISAAFLAQPDFDLYSFSENIAIVRAMARACSRPVIADADTGYGNALNVARTVREFEDAGVAGIVLEDQHFPKRCPLLPGPVQTVSLEQASERIAAALCARKDKDFIVIARTDTKGDEAFERCIRYQELGADIVHLSSGCFTNLADIKRLKNELHIPLSIAVLGWLAEDISREDIEQVANLACFPLVGIQSAAAAIAKNFSALRSSLSTESLQASMMPIQTLSQHLGIDELDALQRAVNTRTSRLS